MVTLDMMSPIDRGVYKYEYELGFIHAELLRSNLLYLTGKMLGDSWDSRKEFYRQGYNDIMKDISNEAKYHENNED